MNIPERCYSCPIHKKRSYEGHACIKLKFNIPYLCPCYDCILLPVCCNECLEYQALRETLDYYYNWDIEDFTNFVLSRLLRRYPKNSLFNENTEGVK